jgi:hypothetical protein
MLKSREESYSLCFLLVTLLLRVNVADNSQRNQYSLLSHSKTNYPSAIIINSHILKSEYYPRNIIFNISIIVGTLLEEIKCHILDLAGISNKSFMKLERLTFPL